MIHKYPALRWDSNSEQSRDPTFITILQPTIDICSNIEIGDANACCANLF